MTNLVISRCFELPQDELVDLVAESEAAGLQFVRSLVNDWHTGTNRFHQPGEALFGSWIGERLVGVCGLNIDPYAENKSIGRIRHLYVLATFRRLGIGSRLMEAVIASARGRFSSLRLRTNSADAAAFYERLGFQRQDGMPNYTHALKL